MATGRLPDPNTAPVTAKGDLYTYSTVPAKLAVGNNGETLVADSSQTTGLRYNPQNALANPVINGGFDIWQRGTSAAFGGAGVVTSADRWATYTAGAATLSRQTTSDTTNLPNIQYSARMQRNAGNTSTAAIQMANSFETVNSIPFAGKAITLSFYARAGANYSPTSSLFNAFVRTGTGTDQNYQLTNYTGESGFSSAVTLTTTWQRFVVTGTIGATVTEIAVQFTFNPTGTAGANDWAEVTGVQIDLGTYTASTAPTFRRSGGTLAGELAACQRYYFRIGRDNSASTSRVYPLGMAISTTEAQVPIAFTQKMRKEPTAVEYADLRAYDGSGFITLTSVTFGDASTSYAIISLNAASGFTQYRPTFPANNGTAYIAFSAEL